MTEQEEEAEPELEEAQEEEMIPDAPEQNSLEEVLVTEAEVLATELEEAAEAGVDPSLLEDIEGSLEAAAESLLTMREARTKLQEVRKDRGCGKPSGNAAGKGSNLLAIRSQLESSLTNTGALIVIYLGTGQVTLRAPNLVRASDVTMHPKAKVEKVLVDQAATSRSLRP